MGKRFCKFFVTIGVVLLLGFAVVAGNQYYATVKPAVLVSFIMDTVVEQKLYGEHSEEATKEIERRLQDFEKQFSMYVSGSDIQNINKNAGEKYTEVSEDVIQLLKRSIEFCEQSKGKFDITVAPLSQLWNITSQDPQVPQKEDIVTTQKLVDYKDLLFDGNSVMLKRKGQGIDLGAVAKGYACDIVRQVAKEYKLKTGYVSIGGNMVVIGDAVNGTPYLFGIRDPNADASHFVGTVTLKGMTMATTGAYERFFEKDGKRYHHILNPKTGYPAESDLLSVSVISEDGTLADCLSTIFFIAGKEKTLDYMNQSKFQLVVVDVKGNVYYSNGLRENFTPNTQTSYTFFLEEGK